MIAAPVCALCMGDLDSCQCVQRCEFCLRDCWSDDVERVDGLFLNRFHRCFACAPRAVREDD